MNKIIGLDTSCMSPDILDEIVAELEDLGLTCRYGAICAKPKFIDVNFDLRHIGFGLYSNLTCSRVNVDEYKPRDYTQYKLYSDDASHKYLIPVHEYHYVVSLLKQAYNDENWDAYEDLLSGYKLLEGQEFTITLD